MKTRLRKYMLSCLAMLLLCALGAGLYTRFAAPVSLEEAVMLAQIDESGAQAQAALQQYPNLTPRLFALYGGDADFKKMMTEFGHNQTFPIVGICFEGGDAYLDLEKRFGEVTSAWMAGKKAAPTAKLEPVECGRLMIGNIVTLRNDFLQRFVIVDGKARRLDTVTALSSFGQLMTGAVQRVERKAKTGEQLTAGDAGDVALEVIGWFGIAKLVLLPKVGLASKLGLSTTLAATPKVAAYAGLAVGGYMVVAHPGVVTAFGGKVAEAYGLNPLVGQALIWFGPLAVLLLILNTLWFWVRPFWWFISSSVKLIVRRKRAS